MIVRRHTSYLGAAMCAALLFAGCTPTAQSPQPTEAAGKPQVNVQTQSTGGESAPAASTAPIRISSDSCEMRLHDLCGPLLYYLAVYDKFPEKLEDLRKLPDLDKNADFTCPITHQPYGYAQNGLAMPDHKGGIIVYDREPHNGVRWAIEIIWPEGASRPLAMVIPLTEETFKALKP